MKRARRARGRRAGLRPGRIDAIACVALLGFAALFARAIQLQTLDADWLSDRAGRQAQTTVEFEALRADLQDRRGNMLAVSATVDSVAAWPRRVANHRAAARALAGPLGVPARELEKRLGRGSGFVWLQRWVAPDAAGRVTRLGLDGVQLIPERRRFYPNGDLAGALLGFADRDGRGLSGIELAYDRELRGVSAELASRRDAHGNMLPTVASAPAARTGRAVRLAIDVRLQHFAESALAESLRKTGARHATLVALDPATGEILALAEAPGFDPNRFWLEDKSLYRARAFVDGFEPGSTMKPFSVALALDAGVVRPDDVFDCENGSYRIGRRTIRDFHPHELLSVSDIVRVSSNIGAAKVSERLGARRLVDGMRRFGFGDVPGSGFPGEIAGSVRELRERQAVERANLSFGQGITVTPVQLTAAMATFANGGRRVTPRLLAVTRSDGEDRAIEPGARVISEQTARAVLAMLRAVVENGTGSLAALPNVAVAGKTGTAQKVKEGTYSQKDYIASFVGIAPAVNPRFVIGVFVDEPRGLHTGGLIAAPVFREVAAYALDQLGGDAHEPAERPSADTGPQDVVPRGRVETRAAHAGGDEG
ncbi:MAG TPA: penicillin-binding protein 2 [Myxococcota bacterium]|nr:penicillin-binding protein 2 [Myxococcota bacterium]